LLGKITCRHKRVHLAAHKSDPAEYFRLAYAIQSFCIHSDFLYIPITS
jgi:hypothetical protein